VAEEIDLAGTLEGSSRSLRGLLRWAGLDIGEGKGFERVRTSGAFRLKGSSLALSKAQFRFDGMNGQGDAALDFKSEKPTLSLALGLDQLDLNRYGLSSSLLSAEADEGIERWGLQPIDFSLLNSFDANVALTAERVIYGRAIMSHARLNGRIDNGVLNAKLEHIDLHQGKAKGQLVLNGAQKAPIAQVGFDAENFNAEALLGGMGGRLKGRADASLALAATGRSPRELIASLRGTAGVTVRDGALSGIDVEHIVKAVAEKIILGWPERAEATSRFDLLKGSFKLADGIAETSDLEASGPGLKFKGKGLVDLLKGEVEMKIEPEFGQDAMNIPVMISGSWSKPKFYPDIAGVLENPTAAYEALKALLSRAAEGTGGEGMPATATSNAGGVAGEALSNEADAGAPARSVDLKKELNTNTIDLMNGFTGSNEPETLSSDP
jgi:AsmA protein